MSVSSDLVPRPNRTPQNKPLKSIPDTIDQYGQYKSSRDPGFLPRKRTISQREIDMLEKQQKQELGKEEVLRDIQYMPEHPDTMLLSQQRLMLDQQIKLQEQIRKDMPQKLENGRRVFRSGQEGLPGQQVFPIPDKDYKPVEAALLRASITPPQFKYVDEDLFDKMYSPLHMRNGEFCSEMAVQPIDGPVLPWWYHYCIDLIDASEDRFDKPFNMMKLKKYVDAEVAKYRDPKYFRGQF